MPLTPEQHTALLNEWNGFKTAYRFDWTRACTVFNQLIDNGDSVYFEDLFQSSWFKVVMDYLNRNAY